MASVSLQNLAKTYGHTHVVKDVSVEIEDGEFVVIVGPSGCGKSTLLRMIAGLESIDQGRVIIGDKTVNALPPQQRDISMVFQNYALYPHMTVAENMGISLTLRKTPRVEKDSKVRDAAEILGLSTLLHRYPRELSGGQRQRVAMGRAMVRNPQVFLFDEPLSNLDAKLRVTMRGEIKALHRRLGATILYVTHDQTEALTMADKIVVLRDGTVEQIGPPLEVYDQPANAFVAQFIGSPSMNLVAATNKDGTIILGNGLRTNLQAPPELIEGQLILVGKRPEQIALTNDAVLGIPGIIKSLEHNGSETFMSCDIGGVNIACLIRERLSLKVGDKVLLDLQQGPLHLFDAPTGVSVGNAAW